MPTTTFEDRYEIDLGGKVVELLHLGWGNTKGDAVLWLPEQKIVATGDMVVLPTPYGFGSYPQDWVESLNRLKALGFKRLIPGHGPVQNDPRYIDLLIDTLTIVWNETEALAAQGLSLEEVRAAIDFSEIEKRYVGDDPVLQNRFISWFETPIVKAAYNLATGGDNEKLERDEEAAEN